MNKRLDNFGEKKAYAVVEVEFSKEYKTLYWVKPEIYVDGGRIIAPKASIGYFEWCDYLPLYGNKFDLDCYLKNFNLEDTVFDGYEQFERFINLAYLYEKVRKDPDLAVSKKCKALYAISDMMENLLMPINASTGNLDKGKMLLFDKGFYFLGADRQGRKHFLVSAETTDFGWWKPIKTCVLEPSPAYTKMYRSVLNTFEDVEPEVLEELKTPFNDDEKFIIKSLLEKYNTAREYADVLCFAKRKVFAEKLCKKIRDDRGLERINEVVIPAILEELYEVLGSNNYEA